MGLKEQEKHTDGADRSGFHLHRGSWFASCLQQPGPSPLPPSLQLLLDPPRSYFFPGKARIKITKETTTTALVRYNLQAGETGGAKGGGSDLTGVMKGLIKGCFCVCKSAEGYGYRRL